MIQGIKQTGSGRVLRSVRYYRLRYDFACDSYRHSTEVPYPHSLDVVPKRQKSFLSLASVTTHRVLSPARVSNRQRRKWLCFLQMLLDSITPRRSWTSSECRKLFHCSMAFCALPCPTDAAPSRHIQLIHQQSGVYSTYRITPADIPLPVAYWSQTRHGVVAITGKVHYR